MNTRSILSVMSIWPIIRHHRGTTDLHWFGGVSGECDLIDLIMVALIPEGYVVKCHLQVARLRAGWSFDLNIPKDLEKLEQLLHAVHTIA